MHEIGIDCGGNLVPLMVSIEGTPLDAWPVSPPMQQMVQDTIHEGLSPVLLGVGSSGNGHWSCAIESHDNAWLKFDIACKNSKRSTTLGSSYQLISDLEWNVEMNRLDLKIPDAYASSGFSGLSLKASIGKIVHDPEQKRVAIAPSSSPDEIRTHRWCYSILAGKTKLV